VSLQTVYRYFASKDELLLGVYAMASDSFATMIAGKLEGIGSPSAQLYVYIDAVIASAATDPALTAASMRENHSLAETLPKGLLGAWEPLLALLEDIVSMADPAGYAAIGTSRRVTEILFHLISAHAHGLCTGTIGGTPREITKSLWASACAVTGLPAVRCFTE
jgi:AcrR family transcriptional regulator